LINRNKWGIFCIASASYFAYVNNNGNANRNNASNSNAVRPRFRATIKKATLLFCGEKGGDIPP